MGGHTYKYIGKKLELDGFRTKRSEDTKLGGYEMRAESKEVVEGTNEIELKCINYPRLLKVF